MQILKVYFSRYTKRNGVKIWINQCIIMKFQIKYKKNAILIEAEEKLKRKIRYNSHSMYNNK